MADLVERVDLGSDEIAIGVSLTPLTGETGMSVRHVVPARIRHRGVEMRLVLEGAGSETTKPDSALIKAVARSYKWFDDLIAGRARFGLERRLPIALQFVTFNPNQRAVLRKASALPRHIETMMETFHERLSPEEQADPQFAYRVAFVPKTVNRASTADLAVEFVRADSEEAAEINRVLLKEVEKPKYRPGQIVNMMQAEGYPRFNMTKHTDLWKALDAKDAVKGFGTTILGGQWCWYDTWLNRVRAHCQENADVYR